MMTNIEKVKRRRQSILNQRFVYMIIVNVLIVFTAMLFIVTKPIEVSGKDENEGESNFAVYESKTYDHNTETSPANASNAVVITIETKKPIAKFSRNLSDEDKYLLAKIAMAEAEGESIETKIYVILTVLNRVHSDDRYFPDTIEEVIFQSKNGIYQFSPVMPGGRWYRIEPNEECWEAVEIVNAMENDISMGALYFEACKGESWHSKNLEFLFESDNTRFYK